MRFYKLDNKRRVVGPITDLQWIEWMASTPQESRVVKQTTIGEFEISTVFLGIDTHPNASGEPLVFETMIFGGNLDGGTRRVSTWNRALENHRAACAMIFSRLAGNN